MTEVLGYILIGAIVFLFGASIYKTLRNVRAAKRRKREKAEKEKQSHEDIPHN